MPASSAVVGLPLAVDALLQATQAKGLTTRAASYGQDADPLGGPDASPTEGKGSGDGAGGAGDGFAEGVEGGPGGGDPGLAVGGLGTAVATSEGAGAVVKVRTADQALARPCLPMARTRQ